MTENRNNGGLAAGGSAHFGAGFEAAYEAIVTADGPYKGYEPAEDPADLLIDMYGDVLDLREALQTIAKIANRNFGRQNEKLADIEPIARAALASLAARSSKEA